MIDHGFIEIMIQKLNMNNFTPVDIGQIGQTLQYCQQRMEIITELIVKEHPTSSAGNLLELLSAIHDVFDSISETTSLLEGSLNGIVGCVDLVVLDTQIALQVLVEAFISNCDALLKIENRSDEAMASSIYCLSSAIKTMLTYMSELVEKVLMSTERIDANVVTGLQMVVQTVLNIVDRVLYCLKRVKVMDLEGVEPSLEKFSLIVQRLANQRLNIVSKISPMIIAPITEVMESLQLNIDHLPLMTRKNVDSLVTALSHVEDTVHEKNISATITSLLDTLQPMLAQLSLAIHSIQGISDAVAYSIDISLQNLLSTVKCLAYSIAIVTKMLPTLETEAIGENLQSMLCFIASSIQSLVDGVMVAVKRALVDLICMSPTMDKLLLEQQLLQLQAAMEPVILTLENVVRTSIELVQNVLSLAACTMGDTTPDLIDDMNVLINHLHRIVKDILESALNSREMPIEDNRIDNESGTSTNENVLSVCIKSFEGVARNTNQLRVLFAKSIDQIRRYLVQM